MVSGHVGRVSGKPTLTVLLDSEVLANTNLVPVAVSEAVSDCDLHVELLFDIVHDAGPLAVHGALTLRDVDVDSDGVSDQLLPTDFVADTVALPDDDGVRDWL
jgi:hypothetical protein